MPRIPKSDWVKAYKVLKLGNSHEGMKMKIDDLRNAIYNAAAGRPLPKPTPKSAAPKPKPKSKAAASKPKSKAAKTWFGVANSSSPEGKFWELTLDGNSLTRRWGKIGGTEQTKTHEYKSHKDAEKEAHKLVEQKSKTYNWQASTNPNLYGGWDFPPPK